MSDHRTALAGVNLNLFAVLDALLRHQSAVQAAKELGVTPSAVSHSLRDLRALFGNDLFVRTGSGLRPTPRAREIQTSVRSALQSLGRAIHAPSDFDPRTEERHFVIASADDIGMTIIPRFVARVLREAPGVSLEFRPRHLAATDLLASASVDLVIQLSTKVPSWIGTEVVYADSLCCMVRADHPQVGTRLTRKVYASLPHIRVAPEGFGSSSVDVVLAEGGVSRRIATYVNSFAMAPEIVALTDAVLTVPLSLARAVEKRLDVRVLKPPMELPDFRVDVAWSREAENDALLWLVGELKEAASTLHADHQL